MKKFKYFLWQDPNIGWGEGDTIYYVKASSRVDAKSKLMKQFGLKHDPDFIRGDVKEVKEFVQPRKIPVI